MCLVNTEYGAILTSQTPAPAILRINRAVGRVGRRTVDHECLNNSSEHGEGKPNALTSR